MLPLDSSVRVFMVLGHTDMRKAINGLSVMVADHLDLNVFTGNLFVFCNRSRTIIKVLYWNHNGFCLWQKRLEKHLYCRKNTKPSVSSHKTLFFSRAQ